MLVATFWNHLKSVSYILYVVSLCSSLHHNSQGPLLLAENRWASCCFMLNVSPIDVGVQPKNHVHSPRMQ